MIILFVNIDALFNIYGWADKIHGYGRGCVISGTRSKQFASFHNAVGQLTNHSTFLIWDGGVSLKEELKKSVFPKRIFS